MKKLWVSGITALLCYFTTTGVNATDALACHCDSGRNEMTGEWFHTFYATADLAYDCGEAGCHTWAGYLPCSTTHPGCTDLAPVAFEVARASGSDQPSQMRYNGERNALQVVGCNGEIAWSRVVESEVAS